MTAPASATFPTFSNGTPIARSAWLVPAMLAAASADPNRSLASSGAEDGAALGQELVVGDRQAAGRAVEDVDGAGVGDVSDVLQRHPDRQISEAGLH